MLGLGSMETALQLRVLFVKKLHVRIYGLRPEKNLSLGFPTKQDSNQSSTLQRLARKLKFHL